MRRDYAGRVDGGEPDLGCELFEALLLVQAFDVARVLVVAELDDLCGHCEPRKTENPAGISPAGPQIGIAPNECHLCGPVSRARRIPEPNRERAQTFPKSLAEIFPVGLRWKPATQRSLTYAQAFAQNVPDKPFALRTQCTPRRF